MSIQRRHTDERRATADPAVGELLERDAELATLADTLSSARGGEGAVAVLDGPAGIGKSRLLSRAIDDARSDGMIVLRARGAELEREISYGLVVELFAPALADAGAEQRKRLLGGQAGLARCLFDTDAEAPQESSALIRGLYWLTVNLTLEPGAGRRGRALAIVVDDVHWGDRLSLGFLAYLAERIDELPVALVLAVRSDEAAAAGVLLDALSARPTRFLRPRRLSEAAVAEIVALGFEHPAQAFVHACAKVSGGNPFLAGELVRALAADGVAPDASSVAAVERLVPDSVLRSVLVRLARLPESAQRLAAACAVLADGASLRHAAELAGLEHEQAETAADTLAAAHVLEPGEPLCFCHPLIATAVQSDQPRFALARAHRRAAELLLDDGAADESVAAHLLMSTPAGDARTVEVLRSAGAHALASGDAAAAVRLLERALAEPPAREQRAALLLELAAAGVQNGDPRADTHIEEALALELSDEQRIAATVALARVRFQQGRHGASRQLAGEALAALGENDPVAAELIADEAMAGTFRVSLRERADAHMTPLVRSATAGTLPEHPALLALLALRLALAGSPPAQVRAIAERATASDPLVNPASHGMLAGIAVQALACVDELDAAEATADAALESAQQRGSLLAYSTSSFHRAIPRYQRGALGDALADLDQALSAHAEGWTAATGWLGALRADVHRERGEIESARESIAFARGLSDETMDHAMLLLARARLALVEHDAAGALADATAAGRHLSAGFGIDCPGLAPWREAAAQAAARSGDTQAAASLAGEAVQLALASGVPRAIGSALRTAALLEEGERRLELLSEALAALEQSPSQLTLVRVLVDYGAQLRRLGRRTDARAPLHRALALADGMGAAPLVEAARAELLASGARPRRSAHSGVDALTPTERRVALLAARGLSNPEIAQALFVTPKTIQTHLTHTYRKLDIASRRELPAALGEGETAR